MTQKKALLAFDPFRRPEQLGYVTDRTEILRTVGDGVWVATTDEQAERFVEQGITVQIDEGLDWVILPAVMFDPLTQEAAPPQSLQLAAPTADSPAYHLVQFVAPPTADWIEQVIDLGGNAVQPIAGATMVFQLTGQQVSTVDALPFVRWTGTYHPAYALGYQLAGQTAAFDPLALNTMAPVSDLPIGTESEGNVELTFFDNVVLGEARVAVESTGADVTFTTAQGFIVEVSAGALTDLLTLEGVFSVQPYSAPDTTNDRGRVIMNVPAVSRFGNIGFQINLNGTGEIVGVIDLGLDHGNPDSLATLHQDILGRVLRMIHHTIPNGTPTPAAGHVQDRGVTPPPASVPYDHGTHVTGTIAGNGAGSGGLQQGVAPAAHIVFQGPLPPGAGVNQIRMAHRLGARVHNNSWGSPRVNPNPPPVTAPHNNVYPAGVAAAIDEFCVLNPESLVIFTSGNDEQDTTGGANGVLDMDRLRHQVTAKNILGVGATESLRPGDGNTGNYRDGRTNAANLPYLQHQAFDQLALDKIANDPDQLVLFSSRGIVDRTAVPPAATNRIKPDIVAPGTNILSLRSSAVPPAPTDGTPFPSGINQTLYNFASGTSMAAPHASGAALLVRQFYRQRYGRLRELTLLEGVDRSASPPPDFVSVPSVAPHADGIIFAWVTPADATAAKRIVASVHARDLTRLHPAPLELMAGVGDSPSPRVAQHGQHAMLLHRDGGGELRLSRYQKDAPPPYNLSLDAGFNFDGTVVVDANADDALERSAALAVAGDDVAVIWSVGSGNRLLWRRFNVLDGIQREPDPVELGTVTSTSPHPYLIHNTNRYAAVWANQVGSQQTVLFALADADGNLTADPPQPVVAGNFDIYDPHLAWNPRSSMFAVVWCERHAAGNQISLRFMNANSTQAPTQTIPVTVAADVEVRRPFIAAHPSQGFVLVWEDNLQAGQFAVQVALLGENGAIDVRLSLNALDPGRRRVLRVSDTKQDTFGGSAFVDDTGIVVAWQSIEETRRDQMDVSATHLTPQGAFVSTTDPGLPMVRGGKYRADQLSELSDAAPAGVSMAWVGGNYYYLGWQPHAPGVPFPRLALVHSDASGRADATYGTNGARELSTDVLDEQVEMHWTGNHLICIRSGFGVLSLRSVTVLDNAGDILDGSKPGTVAFGAGGTLRFPKIGHGDVSPQLADIDLPAANDFGFIVVFGTGSPVATTLHYALLNRHGQFVDNTGTVIPAADPKTQVLFAHPDATGQIATAKHGWFHFNKSDGPNSIATWHQRPNTGANDHFDVFVQLFDSSGKGAGAGLVGLLPRVPADTFDSINAVVAPRPVTILTAATSLLREFGIAWQHRTAPANPWEIRFSRLDQAGAVVPNPAVPSPANPNQNNIQVVFPGMTDAAGAAVWPPDPAVPMHAIEPQLVCTYVDAPWRAVPGAGALLGAIRAEWAPGYGLAWIGQPTTGANPLRTLYFLAIDENGSPIQLDPEPIPAVPPSLVPTLTSDTSVPVQISASGVDVRDFKLIWNGRVFHLTWSETQSGNVRHMRTAITRNGHLDTFAQPSSALLRATLINGATNIDDTSLPNLPVAPITNANRNHGYGWGRINLRQAVAPSGPVTFHAHDDGAVGSGRTAHYRFSIPAGTALLRATLVWTDPPNARQVHNLDLLIRGGGNEYHGNVWQVAANHLHESNPAPGAVFDTDNTTEQIVIVSPAAGDYHVEVIGSTVNAHQLAPFAAQPFALVIVGSGPEVRYQRDADCVLPFH